MLPMDCIPVLLSDVLVSFVLVYPVAAIIVLARPASKSAASFSSLGCRHLRACTGVLPKKAPLSTVRVTARIHVVFGLCDILAAAAAAIRSSHIHPCLQCQPEMLAVVLLCAHGVTVS